MVDNYPYDAQLSISCSLVIVDEYPYFPVDEVACNSGFATNSWSQPGTSPFQRHVMAHIQKGSAWTCSESALSQFDLSLDQLTMSLMQKAGPLNGPIFT